ncbi:MAG: type II toxin-antitoxin system RelE/ParE family toxin [Candidatus Limnocylindria bacterium]|nr:type II toxin-antitoxin system RelE/ParE family toxin [Candidatus Limnocylindria bacterium]
MGRGDRPASSGAAPRNVSPSPRYEVVLADEARNELSELVTYIKKDSPKNAGEVYDAISKRLFQLGANPRIGRADPNAPSVPSGASALITTVKKVAIYYLFPLTGHGREVVYVLSIRRGSRMPLEDPGYARRWLEELATLPAPKEPSAEDPSQG